MSITINGVDVKSFKVGSANVVPLSDYLRAFPEAIDPESVADVIRTEKQFITGNKEDYLSVFCYKINDYMHIDNATAISRSGMLELAEYCLSKTPLYNSNPILKEFEGGNRSRSGTTSMRRPFRDIVELTVGEYYGRVNPKLYTFSRTLLKEAGRRVRKLLKKGSVKPISLDESVDQSPKSTQYCLPYMKKGNGFLNGRKAYEYYKNLAAKDLVRKKLTFIPSMLFMRIQPSGTEWTKHRIAFGVAHHVNMLEGMIQRPLLKRLIELPQFSENAAPGSTDKVVTNMFKKALLSFTNMIGFDATGYDKSLCKELLIEAFGCVKYWCDGTLDWLIDEICRYTYSCDLVSPIGVFVGRDRGVASGLNFTNLIDSIVQLLLHEYTFLRMNVNESNYINPTVQGDDGIWAIKGLNGVILSNIMKEFNIIVNPDKVSVSPDYVTFCQRLYIRDWMKEGVNVGIRSVYRTLNSIVSFERKRNNKWKYTDDIIRAIMQLEEMKHHPVHSLLVTKFCKIESVFGMGSLLPNGIDDIIKRSNSVEDFIDRAGGSSWDQERYGRLLAGIHDFATVKLIENNPIELEEKVELS